MTSLQRWPFDTVEVVAPEDGTDYVAAFNRALGRACVDVEPNPILWMLGRTSEQEREEAIAKAVSAIGGHRWRIHRGQLQIIFPGWTYELLPDEPTDTCPGCEGGGEEQ